MTDMQTRLIDRKTLGEMHHALKSKWRVDYLIRMRRLPFLKLGKNIYFNEASIAKWIEENEHKLQDIGGNDDSAKRKAR